jgi:phage I-like protein
LDYRRWVDEASGAWLEFEPTDFGRQLIKSKTYRYTSAEVELLVSMDRKEGWLTAIRGAALTNRPAVEGMAPVELCQLANPESQQLDDRPGTGQEGAPDMGIRQVFARITGREIAADEDLADASVEIVERLDKLEAKLSASIEREAELSAKLAERDEKLAEYKARDAEGAAKEAVAKALAEGRISPAMVEASTALAAKDLEAWRAATDKVEAGTFSVPGGEVVSEDARHGTAVVDFEALDREALNAEVVAYQLEHPGTGYLASLKAVMGRRAGKGA